MAKMGLGVRDAEVTEVKRVATESSGGENPKTKGTRPGQAQAQAQSHSGA